MLSMKNPTAACAMWNPVTRNGMTVLIAFMSGSNRPLPMSMLLSFSANEVMNPSTLGRTSIPTASSWAINGVSALPTTPSALPAPALSCSNVRPIPLFMIPNALSVAPALLAIVSSAAANPSAFWPVKMSAAAPASDEENSSLTPLPAFFAPFSRMFMASATFPPPAIKSLNDSLVSALNAFPAVDVESDSSSRSAFIFVVDCAAGTPLVVRNATPPAASEKLTPNAAAMGVTSAMLLVRSAMVRTPSWTAFVNTSDAVAADRFSIPYAFVTPVRTCTVLPRSSLPPIAVFAAVATKSNTLSAGIPDESAL